MSKQQFEEYITSLKVSKVLLDSWYGMECTSEAFGLDVDSFSVTEHLEVLGRHLEECKLKFPFLSSF